VTDVAGYEEYQRQVPAYVAAYDGRFIVRGGRTQTLEGSWPARRLVVIEFPSMAKLLAFYDSTEYASLKSLRMHASDSRIIAVEDAADPRLEPRHREGSNQEERRVLTWMVWANAASLRGDSPDRVAELLTSAPMRTWMTTAGPRFAAAQAGSAHASLASFQAERSRSGLGRKYSPLARCLLVWRRWRDRLAPRRFRPVHQEQAWRLSISLARMMENTASRNSPPTTGLRGCGLTPHRAEVPAFAAATGCTCAARSSARQASARAVRVRAVGHRRPHPGQPQVRRGRSLHAPGRAAGSAFVGRQHHCAGARFTSGLRASGGRRRLSEHGCWSEPRPVLVAAHLPEWAFARA
jgi:uncharacterized protein (DUF1330 family)